MSCIFTKKNLRRQGKLISNIINLTVLVTPLNIRILFLKILYFCLTSLFLKLFLVYLWKALIILLRILHHLIYFILKILNWIFLSFKLKIIGIKICLMFHIQKRWFISRIFIIGRLRCFIDWRIDYRAYINWRIKNKLL